MKCDVGRCQRDAVREVVFSTSTTRSYVYCAYHAGTRRRGWWKSGAVAAERPA